MKIFRPHGSPNGSAKNSPSKHSDGGQLAPAAGTFYGDAGYDSYSLSSNDSFPLQQSLKHTLQLSQIPESHVQNPLNRSQPGPGSNSAPWQTRVPGPYPAAISADECERLCLEADQLLERSRLHEDNGDLDAAFALCQSAAQRARAAMDAPYNNPQTLVFARMKHNTCVMRGRSLHRRLLARQPPASVNAGAGVESCPDNAAAVAAAVAEQHAELTAVTGRHSRQTSRDSTRSRAAKPSGGIDPDPPHGTNSSIEIYATLPKKKAKKIADQLADDLLRHESVSRRQESEYQAAAAPSASSTGFLTMRRERAKSEERKSKPSVASSNNHHSTATSRSDYADGAVDVISAEMSSDNSCKNPAKKQHRIRRRLLMGGLMKRKNRSLPDLRADTDAEANNAATGVQYSDSLKPQQKQQKQKQQQQQQHIEDASNVNLEKSKLMRRSFHASLGKNLHATKVPPPPPVRKTSQLSHAAGGSSGCENHITVHADIHHERSCSDIMSETLPPYPDSYPAPVPSTQSLGVFHSRQPSDEFPPPPPPQELRLLTGGECGANVDASAEPEPSALLVALQKKRQEILSGCETRVSTAPAPPTGTDHDPANNRWLQELENKQISLQQSSSYQINTQHSHSYQTNSQPTNPQHGHSYQQVNQQQVHSKQVNPQEGNNNSVRDLASRFEQIRVNSTSEIEPLTYYQARPTAAEPSRGIGSHQINPHPVAASHHDQMHSQFGHPSNNQPGQQLFTRFDKIEDEPDHSGAGDCNDQMPPLLHSRYDKSTRDCVDYPGQQMRPSETIPVGILGDGKMKKSKKSVTFCDQVILVATAEEEHDETYVPNPILQRVLRSAFQQELVKEHRSEMIESAQDPRCVAGVDAGVDEVDRTSQTKPYQSVAANSSKIYQGYNPKAYPATSTLPTGAIPSYQQYPISRLTNGGVPASPMLGQTRRMPPTGNGQLKIAANNGEFLPPPPPSYAPPPQ